MKIVLLLLFVTSSCRAEVQRPATMHAVHGGNSQRRQHESATYTQHKQAPQLVQDYGPIEGHHHHDGVALSTGALGHRMADDSVAPGSPRQQVEHHQARQLHEQHYSATAIRTKQAAAGRHPAGSALAAGHSKVPVLTILVMTTIMALMAGFGAVPFFFVGKLRHTWAGLANAVACGVMLAASFDLLHEGAPYSPTLTIGGMVLGALFIRASQEYLSQFEDASFQELSGADARKAMLIVGVMAAHAFGEGSGVGVSFSGNRGWAQGVLVTIAIGLHNIPEGMAVATVMVAKGAPPRKALFWSLFCAFPQAIVALPSYLFVETFQQLLPVALGFAAGCMIWIVSAELMPDALEAAPHPAVATAATLSAAWLQGLSMTIATLERPDGHLDSPMLADPTTLARVALCMLPALCALPASASLGVSGLASLQAGLGATGGALGALGTTGLVWQLLSARAGGPGALGWLHTLLWAVAGALLLVLLWRNVIMGPLAVAGGGSLETKSSGDHGEALPPSTSAEHDAKQLLVQLYPLPNPISYYSQPLTQAPFAHSHSSNGQSNDGHSSDGSSNGSYVRVVNGGMASLFGKGGAAPLQQQQHGHGGMWPRDKVGNGGHGGGMMQVSLDEYHGSGRHNDGALLHSSAAEAAVAVAAAMHHKAAAGGPTALHTGCGQAFRVGLLAGLLVLLQAALALGERIAGAVARREGDGGTAAAAGMDALFLHWLLPMVLSGVPLGVACVGVGKALAGAGRAPALWAAGLAALAALLAALGCLAGTHLGQPQAEVAVGLASGYDAKRWAPAARAMCAGALLAASLLYVWPAAASSKVARAKAGALVGVVAVVLCELATAGLCAGTPYCIPS